MIRVDLKALSNGALVCRLPPNVRWVRQVDIVGVGNADVHMSLHQRPVSKTTCAKTTLNFQSLLQRHLLQSVSETEGELLSQVCALNNIAYEDQEDQVCKRVRVMEEQSLANSLHFNALETKNIKSFYFVPQKDFYTWDSPYCLVHALHFLEFVQLENFAKNYTNNNPKENAWISIAVNLVVVFAQVFHFRIWVLCLKRKKDVQIK